MKIKFCCDNGANIHSKKVETFDLERHLGITQQEWEEDMTEEEREKMVRDWALVRAALCGAAGKLFQTTAPVSILALYGGQEDAAMLLISALSPFQTTSEAWRGLETSGRADTRRFTLCTAGQLAGA